MRMVCLFALMMCAVQAQDIRTFGAREDATPRDNAQAIQSAVDAAAKVGGGKVVVPKGVWPSGSVWLKSGVELHLDEGAVLKASGDLADYNDLEAYPENWGSKQEEWVGKHLLIAREAQGVSITGPGRIDGSGDAFFEDKPRSINPKATGWIYGMRKARNREQGRAGQLVVFVKCRDVSVGQGLMITNAPCWCLYFYGCENVQVKDYIVRNGRTDGNTDGVDVDCCRNVQLENLDVVTGDDAIAIRGSGKRFHDGVRKHICENVRVRNCRLRAEAMGIRVGVGEGLIRNVSFENVVVEHASQGISFECYYGVKEGNGVDIENVQIRNFTVQDCYSNFRLRTGGDALDFGIRNILFENCTFGAYLPCVRDGDTTKGLENVHFRNCVYTPVKNSSYVGR
ncbi:MAG: glycosyl hydrolase family 28 protein [Kiritimatiellae bacterium]|nr:glycosyl hydrolase family 28 protein [Kiritimatiellia bacterium]